MTVLMRLRQPALAKSMLKLLGIGEWGHVVERANKDGSKSYWSLHDNLLLASTNRDEIERIQQLHTTDNEASLGHSAEFRYMLTQLPIEEKTRSYFYFSDPFIRRLVGPQVKITQLRRLQARAEMEAASAARLLYRLDRITGTPSIDELVAKQYMWEKGTEMVQDFLFKFIGLPPRVSDFFGPDLHLALGDGDPIIVMGSGELTSALGIYGGGIAGAQTLMFALIGALLTRPSVLLIGLTDPDAVRNLLRSLSTGPSNRSSIMGMGAGTLYGVAGKDAWRYDLNIAGLLSMRFGMAVKNRHLVISNQPLSYNPELIAVDTAINNGTAISLSPIAAIRQRPALFASASDKQRQAAMLGIGVLYPLLVTGANSSMALW